MLSQKTKIPPMKRLLMESGLSQADLADVLGVSQRSISYYTTGEREPTDRVIYLLVQMGVSEDFLRGKSLEVAGPGKHLEVGDRAGKKFLKVVPIGPGETKQTITIDGPGFIPGAENQDPPPIFPGISGQAVEDSVRVLAESLAQVGLSLPPDRFAKLCRMASELITAEQLLGKRGDTAEQAKKIVGEILSMVVKG